MSQDLPIGITMGDPAGVGPEIICKALAEQSVEDRRHIVVIGVRAILERANQVVGSGLTFREAFTSPETDADTDAVQLVDVDVPGIADVVDGKISMAAGEAAYRCVVKAAELASAEKISVIVTAPLNKEAMNGAGHHFDGHTGLLAHLTGAKSSFMLLASDVLKTVHVTTHCSMLEATGRITRERVLATIRAGDEHLRQLGLNKPRIAVAGLNPHCGEGGIFGREEIERIAPAVEDARAEGIDATGPIPGDTVFMRTVNGEFDLVISQYHDQGHAPSKLLAFDETVNVSLGLPIRRTSVDHGTAFDVAWTGKANHVNMLAAIAYARRWAMVDI